jgi:quercetin dioxygenase-like cupin family protein
MKQQGTSIFLCMAGIFGALLLALPQRAESQTAAAPPFSSRQIQVSPVTGDVGKQLILMAVAIQPGASVPPHTHPGDCVGSLIEGTVELVVKGQDARALSPGDAYANPRGTVHWFRNVGAGQAKLLNTLVVDTGSPPVQPASAP